MAGGGEHLPPLAPVLRRMVEPGLLEQIDTIEQQSRIDIPGHAIQRAVDNIRAPDTGEVIVLPDHLRLRDTLLQRFDRVERGNFRDPGIAQLTDIGRGTAGDGGEQLLVRRGQRQLLHLDVNLWVFALEIRDQLGDGLAFAPNGPEHQLIGIVIARAAGKHQGQAEAQCQFCEPSRARGKPHGCAVPSLSQPPLNPARSSPLRMYGFFFMTFHTKSLRQFSIISTIGPWSRPSCTVSAQPISGTSRPVRSCTFCTWKLGLNASTKPYLL